MEYQVLEFAWPDAAYHQQFIKKSC